MSRRLAVGLAFGAVASLAVGLWAVAPLVTDPGWPPVSPAWPPHGLAISAIAAPPPPPPPLACPCLYDFDNAVEDEDVGPVATGPFVQLADGSGGRTPTGRELLAPTRESSISQDEAERLLASLPPLPRDASPSIEGSAPEASGPLPPAAAEHAPTLTGGEPPPRPESATGPLTILRASPRGDVVVAPQLAALFSEPMTPVGQTTPEVPRVLLAPAVPGEWRWLGSRLLVFSPARRFPMATDFVARIPEGQRALSGSALERPFEWRFSTPPPSIVERYPETGPARRDIVFFVEFDQAIEPAAVLASIHLKAGNRPCRLRLATEDEISRDAPLRRIVRRSVAGRWVAFRAAELLPGSARVSVTVGPGVPSGEGPRRSTTRDEWALETYGPLVVREAACDPPGIRRGCTPGVPWQVELSNPIDRASFREELVKVDPPVEGLSVSARGSFICIRGLPRPRTSYHVVVAPTVRDRFGGRLGREASFAFETGDFRPVLIAPESEHFVLDPASRGLLTVHSAGLSELRVRLRSVRPDQWAQYQEHRWSAAKLPGQVVSEWTEHPASADGGLVATTIDLGRGLHDGTGQLIVSVEGQPNREPPPERSLRDFLAWVQVTHIGVEASWDDRRVLVRTTALATGQPLTGVAVRIVGGGKPVRTNRDGVAEVPRPRGDSMLVHARLGVDEAFLDVPYVGREGSSVEDGLRIHIIDDRGLYRPGEEVHVKGWARRVEGYPVRRVLPAALDEVSYRLVDAAESEVARGTARVNRYGAFEIVLPLPKGMAVGSASLQVRRSDAPPVTSPAGTVSFRVEEFRRPEVEVQLEPDPAPLFADGPIRVRASARAFNGSPIQGADVQWRVTGHGASFAPPGWNGFTFAPETPRLAAVDESWEPPSETWSGLTDGSGSHALAISQLVRNRARPWTLDVTATAQDVNRQLVSASSSLLVHAGELYVGLRNEQPFTPAGDPLLISVVVAGIDGKAVPGRDVQISVFRRQGGPWSRHDVTDDVRVGRRRVTSASGALAVRLKSLPPGAYRVTASVRDDRGRPAEADVWAWVAGALEPSAEWAEGGEPQPLRLTADRSDYRPGDTARLSVIAPFEEGEGLLTLRHGGVVSTRRFHFRGAAATVPFALSRDWVPGVEAHVDVVGAGRLFASGRLYLPIPPRDHRLTLEVEPRDAAVAPGGRTLLRFAVTDQDRAPVAGAEVAVMAVDEAVLAVLGHRFADPLGTFFAPFTPTVLSRSSRADVRKGGLSARDAAIVGARLEAGDLGVVGGVVGGLPGGVAGSGPPIGLRSDMRALALFAGSLISDGAGRAEVSVALPESLTRFRVFAAVTDGTTRFGTAESSIATRLPLVVAPSPPRFLLPGDTAELPVVVRNETDAPLAVDVAVRGTRASLVAGSGRRLELPAHSRAEARFRVVAGGDGEAQFQAVARAGDLTDAAAFSIPIRTQSVRESAATYGEVGDRPIVQRIELPAHALAGSGTLEITTAATDFSALRDATMSLVAYPYECAEQVASRLLGVATLGETLATLGVEGLPDRATVADRVRRDLLRLRALQQPDGGFTFWGRGRSSPYLTVHVAHALGAARRTHAALANPMIDRVLPYLKTVESRAALGDWGVLDLVSSAQALYVRRLLGDADAAEARRIVRGAAVERLPVEAAGWLLATLAGDTVSDAEISSLRTVLEARVTETAGLAHVATGYDERDRRVLLATDERADAVALEGLLWASPGSDLVPKLTAGLLAARRGGAWSTTQANAWAIVALDNAFRSREAAPPDFTARAWVGHRLVSEVAFRGTPTKARASVVSVADGPGSSEVTLARVGVGTLRYRLGLRYDVDWSRLPAADRGLSVERQYEALDDPTDVRRDADGTWHIRAGARVRVRLALVAPVRRDHVALVSPLAAGLEPLNPSFETSPSPEFLGRADTWWWDRREIRDDRLLVFATELGEGIWTFSCEAVATTPGRFAAPPPRAEEMYSPEVFGRGTPEVVVVE